MQEVMPPLKGAIDSLIFKTIKSPLYILSM
jgi:hypothetical protein